MISVIIPVYNVEKYLKKCLSSILKQTYKNFEIIVVDDGSTDKSGEIIESFKKKYPKKIKAYHKKNEGVSIARNYAIERASGEYLAFIDSDDFIEPDFLEKLYNTAIKDDLDITICDTIMDYPNHQEILRTKLNYSKNLLKDYIISYPMMCIKLVKKSLLDNINFPERTIYEDLSMSPRLVNRTNKIGFLNLPLYHYVQREDSIMHQSEFSEKLYDIVKVLNIIYDDFKNYKTLDEYHDEIEYLFITHLLRSTTLRFLEYEDGEDKLKIVNEIMDEKFPNWKKNIYLKKSSFKLRIICKLAYRKKYNILKLMLKVGRK